MWIKELSPSAFIFMIHVAARVDLEESVRGIRTPPPPLKKYSAHVLLQINLDVLLPDMFHEFQHKYRYVYQ